MHVSFMNCRGDGITNFFADAKEDRRNATELYNPFILDQFEVLNGHPPSWVTYVSRLINGHDIPSNEVFIKAPIRVISVMR